MDKNIFRDISYGMYVVSSGESGCVINTLTQITSDNPVISISLNKENYTNKVIKENKKFVVSILSEKTNPNVISCFGFQTSENVNKYENFDYEEVSNTKVLKENTIGYIVCEVKEIIDTDTHDIFIGKVIDTKKENDFTPMTYKYYHEVIKGKAPKKAPTYIEEEVDDGEESYVCQMCGYVHKGPLPEGFVCPMCGVDASNFEKR